MNILRKAAAWAFSIKSKYTPGVYMSLGGALPWVFNSKRAQLTEGYRNKIVYAVVNVLVRKLIEAPMIVSEIKSEKEYRKSISFNFGNDSNKAGKYNLLRAKAFSELDNHPLIQLLENPNPYQTGIELREHFWFNYNLAGDGFIFPEIIEGGRNDGQPLRLHSLAADRMTAYRDGLPWRDGPVGYWVFSAWDGTQITIYPQDLMHMAKWSPLDPVLGGYSPQIAGARTISKNNANDVAQGAIFHNGGTGTIIGSDSIVSEGKSYFKMTKEQADKIKATVERDFQGAANNGRIHVTNGYVNVQKFGDTLVDMNAIEANSDDAKNIAALWGMSSILIGDKSGGTENNVKEAFKSLVTNVVVSDLRKFDMAFKKMVSPWYSGKIVAPHDLTEFVELAPDLKLMKEVYGDAWYVTGNEKRDILYTRSAPEQIYSLGLTILFSDKTSFISSKSSSSIAWRNKSTKSSSMI